VSDDLTRLHAENLALKAELRAAAEALEEADAGLPQMRLRSSEWLAEAGRRREHLVAELSHRIKNDLQLVASLLRSQAVRQENPEAAAALNLAVARVGVVARIHDLLRSSDGSGTVAFDRYLRETCAALAELLGADGRHRTLLVHAEAATLTADTARSLGLVVNELVTNAFRHAFMAADPGTVWVEFGRDPAGRLRLSVSDDGTGLTDGFGCSAGGGLGLRLVTATAKQLGAALDIERDGGTHVMLTLPA